MLRENPAIGRFKPLTSGSSDRAPPIRLNESMYINVSLSKGLVNKSYTAKQKQEVVGLLKKCLTVAYAMMTLSRKYNLPVPCAVTLLSASNLEFNKAGGTTSCLLITAYCRSRHEVIRALTRVL